jgi:hypothetical protein
MTGSFRDTKRLLCPRDTALLQQFKYRKKTLGGPLPLLLAKFLSLLIWAKLTLFRYNIIHYPGHSCFWACAEQMVQMLQDINANFLFCFFVITDRTEQVGSRAKTFDFYSEGPSFESRLKHKLSLLSFRYLHQLHVVRLLTQTWYTIL